MRTTPFSHQNSNFEIAALFHRLSMQCEKKRGNFKLDIFLTEWSLSHIVFALTKIILTLVNLILIFEIRNFPERDKKASSIKKIH